MLRGVYLEKLTYFYRTQERIAGWQGQEKEQIKERLSERTFCSSEGKQTQSLIVVEKIIILSHLFYFSCSTQHVMFFLALVEERKQCLAREGGRDFTHSKILVKLSPVVYQNLTCESNTLMSRRKSFFFFSKK